MYNLHLTRYYNANSPIHNIDSFYKVICILIFTVLVLLTNELIFLSLLCIGVLILIVLSEVPIKLYINNLKFCIPIIIFIIIINLIFSTSFLNTIVSIMKLILFILYSAVMMYTTKPNDLTFGIEKLLYPLRVFNISVSVLSLTISLAIRFIPIIFEQASKVLKSQCSRGLDFSGSIKEKCIKLVSVLVPIFSLSFKRADQISDVLEMRLYKVEAKRTKYKSNTNYYYDSGIVFSHVMLFIIYIVVEVIK